MEQLARNVSRALGEYNRGVLLLYKAMHIIDLYIPEDSPGIKDLKNAVKNFENDLRQTIIETTGGSGYEK